MTKDEMVDAIEAGGYDAQSYSGRSMYGRECVAFTTDAPPMRAAAEVIEGAIIDNQINAEAVCRAFKEAKWDNMGTGTIIYFPRIPWE